MAFHNFRRINIKKNALLLKIFLSMLLIAVFVVILLTISVFFWFRGKAADDFNKVNKILLLNIDTAFSNYLENARNLTVELYQNIRIKTLITQNQLTMDQNDMASISIVRNGLEVNSYINSIYILNGTGTILDVAKLSPSAEAETNLIHMVRTNKVSDGPFFWVMQNKYPSKDGIKTMTYFYHEGVAKGGYFGGAAVINLNMDVLQKNLFSDRINGKQSFYIIDNTGKILIHSDMKLFDEDVSSQPYIKKILGSKNEYETFNMKFNGRNNTFSYISSNSGRYFIVSQMEYAQSISDLVQATNMLLGIGLAILLLMVFISGFISFRLYKPFGNIVTNIRNMFMDLPQRGNLNEIQFLSNTFGGMMEKLDLLKRESDYNSIVRILTSSDTIEESVLEESLIKTGVLEDIKSDYLLVVVRIDGFRELIAENTPEEVLLQVGNISRMIRDMICKSVKCSSFQISNDELVLIMSEADLKKKITGINLSVVLKEVQEAVLKAANISLSIGVSMVENNIRNINKCYREVKYCTQYRLFYGDRVILDYESIALLKNAGLPGNSFDMVFNAVKCGSQEEFEASLNAVLDECKKYTFENSVKFLSSMALSILELSKDIFNEGNFFRDVNYLEIYNKINEFEGKKDLVSWFIGLYQNISQIIKGINSKKTHDILLDIVGYINQNYNDPQLSANMLAERLSISTQYFSKIFNDLAGCSITEYVNNIRLEKARELLMNHMKMDINSIAEQVGFRNTTYFTTVFKKKYGVTPSKLRLTVLRSEIIS